jgi:large subunit ribosomal protein L29
MLKMTELTKLSKEELVKKETDLRKDLFDLKIQKTLGTLEKSATLMKLRRDIARVKTAQNAVKA